MSLKCSLFGHRYGDTEVRRDREQEGSEFVETVQELKVCTRCGEELVVSETTEVTTVEAAEGTGQQQPDSEGIDRVGRSETGRSAGTPRSAGTTGPIEDTDAGSGDAGRGSGPASSDGPGSSDTESDQGPAGTSSPVSDAGADASDAGGPGGSTPESPATGPTADTGTDSSSYGSTDRDPPPARKDDAIILGEDDDEDDAGEWPDDSEEETDDWEPETEPETDPREGGSAGTSGGLTVPEGEFHCPECGFTTAVESSSLREGDFCPECHRGALEHRME